MQAELAGMIAGFAATAPMTASMYLMHRALPEEQRYPLPPRQIVDNAAAQSGLETETPGRAHHSGERRTGLEDIARDERAGVALASHFAFGAMAGGGYGPIARARPASPVLAGITYGLMVWGSQYLGVLPAVGVLSHASNHPARRNALMIAAHVVWGASLGILADRFVRRASAPR
jgi:uncharacterized membrane protein YagU involved in acid resistance